MLLVTMHHIVSDGWSIGVLIKELSALYEPSRGAADPLPALPCSTPTMRPGSGGWLEGSIGGEQARYWQKALAGAPPFWLCLQIMRVLRSKIMPAPWLGCA